MMMMAPEALAAAKALAQEGIVIEVVDLRTLRTWERDTVLTSVAKTRYAVVVVETPPTGGLAADFSVIICEYLYSELAAPVTLVTAKDAPIPMAPALEQAILPSRKDGDSIYNGESLREFASVGEEDLLIDCSITTPAL